MPQLTSRPTPLFTVEVHPDAAKATQKYHQEIAAHMSKMQFVPGHRLRHFGWVLGDARFRVKGWHAYIESTAPVPGGTLVTLQIQPLVDSTLGVVTSVLDYSLERYRVMADGSVDFVEGVSPFGSGRPLYSAQ